MVEEVAKIIYNSLVTRRGVYMPQVGTLNVRRIAARRVSRNTYEPPRWEVCFSKEESGAESLVDMIAREAGVDSQVANEVYTRWLRKVTAESADVFSIEGVGELNHGVFIPVAEFERNLNPAGEVRVKLPRRTSASNAFIYTISAVAALISLCAIGLVVDGNLRAKSGEGIVDVALSRTAPLYERCRDFVTSVGHSNNSGAIADSLLVANSALVAERDSLRDANSRVVDAVRRAGADSLLVGLGLHGQDTTSQQQTAAAVENRAEGAKQTAVEAEAQSQMPTDEILRMRDGWSYVVYGVYSTQHNALRELKALFASHPKSDSARVYRFGSKYMIILYASADSAAAQKYKSAQSREWEDLWVYSKK